MKHRRLAQAVLLALLVCAAGVAAAGDEPKLGGDEIVAKHLAAVGGREALAKFKTRVAVGTVKKENEPEGKFAVMSEAPNRLSVFYGFRDYDLRMIYDGRQALIRPDFPARQVGDTIADKYREILSSGLMFNSVSLYNLLTQQPAGELKFEAKGTKKVAGRPAYVVELKAGKGTRMRLYFDAENFMWVRTDYGSVHLSQAMGEFTNDRVNQGGSEATVDFYIETSDFRDVDGVKLPFKFQQVMTAPVLREKSVGTITGTIREYRHNVEIDPKMFR
jgi:outer membrane lipoprotein-sorting protein